MSRLAITRVKVLRTVFVLLEVLLLIQLRGVTLASPPQTSSRDVGDLTPLAMSADQLTDALATTDGSLISCGWAGGFSWTTTSDSFLTIHKCSLSIPKNGHVFIAVNGSLARLDGEYQARFRVGIDDKTGEFDTDRWIDVGNDAGDGSDRSVAISAQVSSRRYAQVLPAGQALEWSGDIARLRFHPHRARAGP